AGHRGPADEHRHAAGGAAPDDVLRGPALEHQRVDQDVEEDRDGGQHGRQPAGAEHDRDRDRAERDAEDERGPRRDRVPGQRAGHRAPHHRVDVPVEVAVQRVGAAGGQRAADHGRQHGGQRRQPAGGQDHRRQRRDQQQLDDARLGQRHVRAQHREPAAAAGGALGRHVDRLRRGRHRRAPRRSLSPRQHLRHAKHCTHRSVGTGSPGYVPGGRATGRPIPGRAVRGPPVAGMRRAVAGLRSAVITFRLRPPAGQPAPRRAGRVRPVRRGASRVNDSSEQPAPGADAAEPVEQAPAPAPEQPAEARPPVYPEGWTDEDSRIVDMIRALAMDAVQKTGNGHPGTAMSLAPVAYTLFHRIMRHDPADPNWLGRDRFVLSAGHSSLTLYIQLYLSGYGLELDDLKALRTWGSLTPGHPEHGHTAGVETTTGPLGQGVGNAVGFAMAARRERGLLDPDAAPGESVFDHRIFVICSDGDMEEGVSGEASSLAGHQKLGNLTMIYDDNKISIEDDTNIALSEDVGLRYEAYGWHVQTVEWRRSDGTYVEDVAALEQALKAAEAETERPSFIRLRTIIAWPAPNAQNTGKAHGAALGADEVAATKKVLGLDPDKTFDVDPELLAHAREVRARGQAEHAAWNTRFEAWSAAEPERRQLLDRLRSRTLPAGWTDALPTFDPDPKGIA